MGEVFGLTVIENEDGFVVGDEEGFVIRRWQGEWLLRDRQFVHSEEEGELAALEEKRSEHGESGE